MTLDELRSQYRAEVLGLAERHGARNVRVFGSVVRGEEKPCSDVDFLVEFEPGRSLLDCAGLWLDLQELLGCQVDLVEDGGISPYLHDRILAEARPL